MVVCAGCLRASLRALSLILSSGSVWIKTWWSWLASWGLVFWDSAFSLLICSWFGVSQSWSFWSLWGWVSARCLASISSVTWESAWLIDNHGWADLRVSNALTLTPNSVDKNFTILLYSSILIALFFVMICISETGVLLISIAPLNCSNRSCREYSSVTIKILGVFGPRVFERS
ncbi:hypothetical protein BTURTLESOX_2315 [bacterium endosymbiont of Bathymodiolus sp. 5 South]|nr:hypothetical protein BTURTLESOX_2315 [bacterium endosymbiont of Bathymodiolus sp. 5 South]